MNRILLIISCSLFLITAAFAADHYYYENGQRVDISPVQEFVLVQPGPGFTTWNSLITSKLYLDPNFAPILMAEGFFLLRVNAGYSSTTATADLRQTAGVLFANKQVTHPQGWDFRPSPQCQFQPDCY